MMNPEKIYHAWKNYNAVRIKGDKKAANVELTNLINDFHQLPKDLQEITLITLVGSYIDDSGFIGNNGSIVSAEEVRIQHPLFKEILLPYITDLCKSENAIGYRWAAQLSQFFYSDYGATKKFLEALNIREKHFDCEYFLDQSYTLDPIPKTAELIMQAKYTQLSYATHELPRFLLKEPTHYISYYEEFVEIMDKVVNKPTGEHYDFFNRVYLECKNYIKVSSNYQDFESYLKQNRIVLDW